MELAHLTGLFTTLLEALINAVDDQFYPNRNIC